MIKACSYRWSASPYARLAGIIVDGMRLFVSEVTAKMHQRLSERHDTRGCVFRETPKARHTIYRDGERRPLIETLAHPAFLATFALIQAVVFLLLIRFLDLYEREPLSVLALMAAWGATGAIALSMVGNRIILGLLPRP